MKPVGSITGIQMNHKKSNHERKPASLCGGFRQFICIMIYREPMSFVTNRAVGCIG